MTVDEYIAGFPEDVQEKLQKIRKTVRAAAPDAAETIRYQIPTVVLNGNLVHFAAFRSHIGFYPTPGGIDGPLPLALIARIVKFRVKEQTAKKTAKKK
ncbi:MAG TPA: hypothetical protein VHK90_10980 [Thermoanaerobaculia bacterium]|nr:hypothetical protein [Thermoanaerobaculia bacterium]